jgi:hypothetical protein
MAHRAVGIAGLACFALAIASFVVLTPAARAETTPTEAAECVVDNDASRVDELLQTVPGSLAEAKKAGLLVQLYGACMDNRSVKGSFSWLERAELATAALNKSLMRGSARATATPAAWEAIAKTQRVSGDTPHALGLAMFGACVVHAAPEASLQYFRAGPTEAAALVTMRPALESCMEPGKSLRVTPAQLRLIVAEPLYHALVR